MIQYTNVSEASVSTNLNLAGFYQFTIILILDEEPLFRDTEDILQSTVVFLVVMALSSLITLAYLLCFLLNSLVDEGDAVLM